MSNEINNETDKLTPYSKLNTAANKDYRNCGSLSLRRNPNQEMITNEYSEEEQGCRCPVIYFRRSKWCDPKIITLYQIVSLQKVSSLRTLFMATRIISRVNLVYCCLFDIIITYIKLYIYISIVSILTAVPEKNVA